MLLNTHNKIKKSCNSKKSIQWLRNIPKYTWNYIKKWNLIQTQDHCYLSNTYTYFTYMEALITIWYFRKCNIKKNNLFLVLYIHSFRTSSSLIEHSAISSISKTLSDICWLFNLKKWWAVAFNKTICEITARDWKQLSLGTWTQFSQK